jgi:hypothetical protein
MGSRENDPDYRPSLNVRKGYVGGGGGACNAQPGTAWPIGAPPSQVTGLPLDREWPFLDGRMGNGNWNFATYWQVNHGADDRLPPKMNGAPASNSNLPSRYEVYRYEIDEGFVSDGLSAEGRVRPPAAAVLCPMSPIAACSSGDRQLPDLGLVGGAQSNVPVAALEALSYAAFAAIAERSLCRDYRADESRRQWEFDMVHSIAERLGRAMLAEGLKSIPGDYEGSALVEGAVLMPLLLVLVFGVYEFSWFFYQQHIAAIGVRDAARYLARVGKPCDVESPVWAIEQMRAKDLAITGSIGGGAPRIKGWSPSMVTLHLRPSTIQSDRPVRSPSRGAPVAITASPITDPPGFFSFLQLAPPSISVSHSERSIGSG